MDTVFVRAVFGTIEAFKEDLITQQIMEFGAHTRPELAFLLSIIDANSIIFDIGAHIGTFTIPIAQRIGKGGKVIAVEGFKKNYDILANNVELHKYLSNIIIINSLVGDMSLNYKWETIQDNSGASFLSSFYDENSSGNNESFVGIDQLALEYGFPDVIKIDIEGFEFHALKSSPKVMARHPVIYAEICEDHLRRNNASTEEFNKFLKSLGYIFFKNVGERNAKHDNFIVKRIDNLAEGGEFYDVLAVHSSDEKSLSRLNSNNNNIVVNL